MATMAGVSQRVLMEILGHRTPTMTARYSKLSPEFVQQQAVRALDHLDPQVDNGQAKDKGTR